jgi:hypothetical protein
MNRTSKIVTRSGNTKSLPQNQKEQRKTKVMTFWSLFADLRIGYKSAYDCEADGENFSKAVNGKS